MHPIFYAIIGVVIILLLGPAVFADRSPIPETSGKVTRVHAPVDVETILKSSKYVVVDFYADWCPPCRAIAPIFSKLADDHAVAGQLGFAKVNVDHVKDVAQKYGITAMPTFLFFEHGKPTSIKIERKGAEESVEQVRGADVALLKNVVQTLAKRVGSSRLRLLGVNIIMAEYDFSTRAGFQLAMKNALCTSSPEETKQYAEATVIPDFYHIINGKRHSYEEWFASLEEWRGKITGYEPRVEEFLRDDDQLAARMTSVLDLGGKETFYECFFFAKVDRASGKLASLTERAVWGEVGGQEVHGAN